MNRDLERFVTLDARLVKAAKEIKILSRLTWPDETRRAFLGGWEAGSPRLPSVSPPRLDFAAGRAEENGRLAPPARTCQGRADRR